MAADPENPYLLMRSVIETPVLDERKWAKLADIPSDGIICDMEDAVPRTRKLEGREAVIRNIQDPGQLTGRVLWARPNHLSTEWGHDDTVALAKAGVEHMMMPKIESAEDIHAYQRILHEHGANPNLIPCIESPGAIAHIEEIVEVDRVVAISFGEGDLTVSMGVEIFLPDGSVNPLLQPARARVYLAAAACNVARFDIAFLHDLKDLDEFRQRALLLQRTGATGMTVIYPPHVEVANEVFSPSPEQVAHAREVVATFDEAIAKGDPAVQLPDGKAILIHDYLKAQRILARAI